MYNLGQTNETGLMTGPTPPVPAEPAGMNLSLLAGVGLWLLGGAALAYLLSPKANKMRNAALGAVAGFGAHYLLQGKLVALPAPAPEEAEQVDEF